MLNKICVAFALILAASFTISAQTDWATHPIPTELPTVTYPYVVMESGLSGKVTVTVNIDTKGNVTSISSVDGPDGICSSATRSDVVAIHEAAKNAAMTAKFRPSEINGKAIASTSTLNFEFTPPNKTGSTKDNVIIDNKSDNPNEIYIDVLNEKALSLPEPIYPRVASMMAVGGSVQVEITIDPDGTVYSADAVGGHPLLKAAARTAACSAKFAPILVLGKPVRVSGIIKYYFKQ